MLSDFRINPPSGAGGTSGEPAVEAYRRTHGLSITNTPRSNNTGGVTWGSLRYVAED